jgi:hypothetical protein
MTEDEVDPVAALLERLAASAVADISKLFDRNGPERAKRRDVRLGPRCLGLRAPGAGLDTGTAGFAN